MKIIKSKIHRWRLSTFHAINAANNVTIAVLPFPSKTYNEEQHMLIQDRDSVTENQKNGLKRSNKRMNNIHFRWRSEKQVLTDFYTKT